MDNWILNINLQNSISVFDNDGELKPIPEIRYSSINLNARFGITDKIAGSIYAPVFNTASNAESSDLKVTEAKSKSGIGDIIHRD